VVALFSSADGSYEIKGHDVIQLRIGADKKAMLTHAAKAPLLVERHAAGVALPRSEPKNVTPPGARLSDARVQQRLAHAVTVPAAVGVDALHLGGVFRSNVRRPRGAARDCVADGLSSRFRDPGDFIHVA